ncbi:MAG: SpoIID/LytB domain-containing protein, partial [Bacilli bacterium]
MKKVLLFSMLIILIPFIVVNIFFKKEEISFSHIDSFKVRIKRADKIDKVYFEDYIVGVLAGEMPVSFDIEALKAQAVAARSYALIKINENKGKDYDLVDTVMNQVYLDYEYLKKTWKNDYINNINKIKEAVQKTEGQYLEYKGEIAYTFFFSTSTGKTENSEEIFGTEKPYLKSVDSKWDDISPVFT